MENNISFKSYIMNNDICHHLLENIIETKNNAVVLIHKLAEEYNNYNNKDESEAFIYFKDYKEINGLLDENIFNELFEEVVDEYKEEGMWIECLINRKFVIKEMNIIDA